MNKFYLEIITPEKKFYADEVEKLKLPTSAGECLILANHQPMVFALEPGTLVLTQSGEAKEAFTSEGFVEIRPDVVVVFSQAVEWPEDIDEHRAREAQERAQEQLRLLKSEAEFQLNKRAMQRAFARLKLKKGGHFFRQ